MGNCVSFPDGSVDFVNTDVDARWTSPAEQGKQAARYTPRASPSAKACSKVVPGLQPELETDATFVGTSHEPHVLAQEHRLRQALDAANSNDSSTVNSQTTSLSGSSSASSSSFVDEVFRPSELLNDYTVGEELGAGRYGTVVACTRRSDGRQMACKVISNTLGARDAAMEVEVLNRLRGQKGIVQIEAVYLKREDPRVTAKRRATEMASGLRQHKPFFRIGTSSNHSSSNTTGSSTSTLSGPISRSRAEETDSAPSTSLWSGQLEETSGILGRHAAARGPHDIQAVEIVMQRCYGGTIADRLKVGQGFFPESEALRALHAILSTVQLLHDHGFIYRDVKDTNFLFQTEESRAEVVAIDFGLAMPFKPGEPLAEVAGSPLYIAPEVVRRSYGPQCDVWSAGVLLHQMLCGRHAFQRDNVTAVLKAVTGEGVLDLESAPWPAVSPEAKQLLRAMLTRDPQDRPTPAQLLQCLTPDGTVVPDSLSVLKPLPRPGHIDSEITEEDERGITQDDKHLST